ncbi:U-box domain-containing protein kinase family protein [Rhynchospora pubera]|uniref:RING-type E3 ubiquitin transferase n=1 Tax=Rhynchospora pubera TaxID=906938 RepID=A0AAV8F0V9_9POAL|nr:U-box domain-containing protein kinase family protein [Rhynchospora pubera]
MQTQREEDQEEKLYVAVPEKSREGMSVLMWVLRNAPKDAKIVITHVYMLDQMIPSPLGGRVHPSAVDPLELIAYRQDEKAKVARKLDDYAKQCSKAQFKWEKLIFGSDDIANGIVDLIALKEIKKLIMGAAEDRHYSMRMIEPTSNKAKFVMNRADPSCTIWFVCKGNLIFTRESNQEKLSKSLPLSTCSCSVSQRPQEQYTRSSSRSSPGTSYRISDTGSLSITEADVASYTNIELQDALVDLTSIVRKVEDSFSRQRQRMEHEVESLKVELNEKENLLQEANRQNLTLESRIREQEEIIASVNRRINLVQSENIQLRSDGEQNLKLLQETTMQKLVLEECFKGLGDSLATVKGNFETLLLENKHLQQEKDRAIAEYKKLHQTLTTSNDSLGALNFQFSFSELVQATENFSDLRKIGEGGFGCVYKGFLRNTLVAIKKLHPQSLQDRSNFEQEIVILSKLRHPNLVTLIGACSEASALVYEYLPNGNLEDRLMCTGDTSPLTWQVRTRIIGELCSVLIYLHSTKPYPVVHGDIKPDNILLDANLVSKLSDFGISRILNNSSSNNTFLHRTKTPRGTFQYMDPELFTTGTLTTKSDVYSFGIIVLRLLTRKSPINIRNEVENALEKNQLHLIIDASAGDWPFVQAKQLVELGLRCTDLRRRYRPDLDSQWEVVEPLMKAASLPVPSYFVCPIRQEVMRHPHIAADGYSYEAEAIKGWFQSGYNTSPVTNLVLPHLEIFPNHTLHTAIQNWLQPSSFLN